MYVIGINSSSAPFMAWIGTRGPGRKLLETRGKDTLGRYVGQRVILAETKQGGYLALYSAVIRSARPVRSLEEWDALRPQHRVPVGNRYDWKPGTRIKWVYEIANLRRLRPFLVPEGVRHGRTCMEYDPKRKEKQP